MTNLNPIIISKKLAPETHKIYVYQSNVANDDYDGFHTEIVAYGRIRDNNVWHLAIRSDQVEDGVFDHVYSVVIDSVNNSMVHELFGSEGFDKLGFPKSVFPIVFDKSFKIRH